MRIFVVLFCVFVDLCWTQQQNQLPFVPPDRVPTATNPPPAPGQIDIYDPFKTTTRANEPQSDEVLVRITPGQVIGKKISVPNLTWNPDREARDFRTDKNVDAINYLTQNVTVPIYTFLGIPFAQKPVGVLRFKPPQKLPRFAEEVLIADKYKSTCAQDVDSRPTLWLERPYAYNVDEDCLYLNVFTPEASRAAAKSYPVIVFFHGGNFQYGSSNDWPAYVLSTKGLVVVTANYRLGAFGFLSLGGKMANYGLWDQKLVLEWVRENIYAFSGDPERVTIVGHDAGAVSAGLHMLSPASKGYFSSVAAMSGADVSYHQVITHPMLAYNNTIKLGRMVGCSQLSGVEVLECLLTRSTNDIIAGTRDMLVEYNRFAFLPTVDQLFLPEPPLVMLRNKRVVSPATYLTGVNTNDGTEVLLSQRDLARTHFHIDQQFMDWYALDYVIKRNFTTNREALVSAIKYLYTFWPDVWSDDKVRDEFLRMATDAYYTAPVSLAAQLRSESGSMVFMYVNAYNFSTGALNPNANFLPPWMGVCHECDLFLLFGFPWMPKEFLPLYLRNVTWTAEDKAASEVFMSMWKQFAMKKDPNLPNDGLWVNYGPRDHQYLLFNVTRKLLQNFDWEHVAFWNVYIDQLGEFFTTTFSPTIAVIRKELIGYKATTGVFIVLFALAILLAATLWYSLCEKRRRQRRKEAENYQYEYQFDQPNTKIA